MDGSITVWRRLLEDPLWTRGRFSRGHAWIDLLLLAEPRDTHIPHCGRDLPVARGQVFTSIVWLAARWQWNRKTVTHFLRDDRTLSVDIHAAIGADIGYTIITIQNYGKYQAESETDRTLERTLERTLGLDNKSSTSTKTKQSSTAFSILASEPTEHSKNGKPNQTLNGSRPMSSHPEVADIGAHPFPNDPQRFEAADQIAAQAAALKNKFAVAQAHDTGLRRPPRP